MKMKQMHCSQFNELDQQLPSLVEFNPNVVIIHAGRKWFEQYDLKKIKAQLPKATVIGCSTAGEISHSGVHDNTIVIMAAQFKNPLTATGVVEFENMSDSFSAGKSLAEKFDLKRLTSMFVLGKGLNINGSKLIEGIQSLSGSKTQIAGGLAGDGADFKNTFVLLNDKIYNNAVVALGVYDNSFSISTGSQGGWKPFGPIRKVTKAKENVLFEIDGKPALEKYKEYLGENAAKLPAAGLLFPLEILDNENQATGTIRTILAMDDKAGTITFAGEIGEGKLCRLMHTKNEGLIAGAEGAANMCKETAKLGDDGSFAILVSCVGRKLVMADEIDDEVDAVKEVLSLNKNVIGFYSYGEISPHPLNKVSALHNQTMTITYFYEGA